MRPEVRLALCALCWAVLAPYAIAQSETNPPAQVEPPQRPARQRPGKYPDYLFLEPLPAPTVETSEEFREKYLLGDWLGARSQLAADGIKPQVLFITDPFVNAAGGQRRGFSEYDLRCLDLLLDTNFAGFGLAYGSYSGDLRRAQEVQALTDRAVGVQSWEMTLEWTYGCTVKPGLLVQPSLQYLVNPGGNKAVPNALAVGVNIVFNF